MATDNRTIEEVGELISKTRAECHRLGLSQSEVITLFMDEALLEMIDQGASLEAVQKAFHAFADTRAPKWFHDK